MVSPCQTATHHAGAAQAVARELGIEVVVQGSKDKFADLRTIVDRCGCTLDETAMMGDDWPDLGLISRCAFSAAPANAHHEVRARVDFVSRSRGGEGTAREFCDLLLIAAGRYDDLLQGALS